MATEDSSPITFLVPGEVVPGGLGGGTQRGRVADGMAEGTRWLPGQVKASVRVAAQRSAGTPHRLTAVPGEDVVALHVANGPVLLLHPANARDLMLAQTDPAKVTRGRSGTGSVGAEGEVEVSAQLRWRGLEQSSPVTRGLGDVLLKGFEIITGLAKDKAVDFAASQVVQRVDAQVEAGLYELAPETLTKLKGSGRRRAALDPKLAAQGPLLVFVHGTFVETTSTFGKLWTLHPRRVRQLFENYGNRVFALEHETLGKSPIANALELVRALPAGARLHLVTHSRGGLVAEVLAVMAHQRAATAADLSFFAAIGYATQRAELLELANECSTRKIVVERVVRVACPARGTLLAARRLDAYLSVLKWGIEATGVPLVPEFVDFLSEVARRRAEPEQIPGLAAMIPETPLVRWLNARREPVGGELRVVAGDLEGDSIGSWIKTLLADAYYWTDNDIVVQTRSMYAGAPRAGGASFLLDQTGKTTHFAYFANPRTVEAVVEGVIRAKAPDGFAPIGPLSWAGKDAGGLRGQEHDPAKPAVFVLPGILGSHLKHDGDRIWLSLRLIGGLDQLSYQPQGTDGVLPDGAIGAVYDALISHLRATHEVIEFSFDWRRPIQDEALRLAKAVDSALDARKASGQPVRLLAHSMGGLVARTMLVVARPTWERMMARPGARLLMLGTPNGGSYAPMQVLSGDDTFGNTLAALGSPLADRKARQIMAAMPGFLQLQAGLLEPASGLARSDTWKRLAEDDYQRVQQNNWWHRHAGEAMDAAYQWGVPPQPVLDAAVELRRALDKQRDEELPQFADKLLLVVGHAKATPVGYEVGNDGFVYQDAADGDGRVPRASALLPGVKTWKLEAEHGSLPSAKGAFDAFVELLDQGTTRKLETLEMRRGTLDAEPRSVTRSRPSRERKAARPAAGQASVFSVTQDRTPETSAEGGALRIVVLNGNLSFVAEPMIIGHYSSSELTGTEAVMDRLLGRKMTEALQVGHYPDALGTEQVFVNTWRDPEHPWRPPRPQAVVVVGLGDEGALRESDLVKGVQRAVYAWSQRLAEEPGRGSATIEIAATLLGSGGLGVSASASARAVARGVRQANLALAQVGWPVVSQLTLAELYLDRASEAWQGLQVLAGASPEAYTLAPIIRNGTGPLRRKLESGYRGADYDLITAISPGEGVIEFALDSRRARTEVRAQRTQAGLVREMVKRGATASAGDDTIGRTLFQLLVPVEIEPFLGGTDRMVLALDPETAAIPWELLDAGEAASGSDHRPWAVRSQLMRRLRMDGPRVPVRDAKAEDHVLVIGEPMVDKDSGYPPLPGAKDEAKVVQETLTAQGGLDFERVHMLNEEPDAMTVVGALLARAWRIVHIAGHGEAPADGGRGVVLSGGHFLGSAEIASMRTLPELVFVNCCHLGALQDVQALGRMKPADHAAFAAGVAAQLIEMGVRCVVACGWAVDDSPAHEFARRFYRELLAGARFIDALAAAREACWLADPTGKTWAAYQCYGDPGWRFTLGPRDAQSGAEQADEFAGIASAVGLALVLDTMVIESRFMGRKAAEQQDRLRQLEARFGDRFGEIGAVAEAFGVAWEAAGERNEAIRWLTQAVAANDASASLKAEETLQNLRARRAWENAANNATAAATEAGPLATAKAKSTSRRARAPAAGARGGEDLALALQGLQRLVQDKPTAERFSLLGSAHKRKSLIERRAGDRTAELDSLRASRSAYERGVARAAEEKRADFFYPALNVMALDLVTAAYEGSATKLPTREAARASLAAKLQSDPDFWSQVSLVEFDLDNALAQGHLARVAPALAKAFEDLHLRVQSTNYWSSVADQADLVLGVFSERGAATEREAARSLWHQLLGYAGRTSRHASPRRPGPK